MKTSSIASNKNKDKGSRDVEEVCPLTRTTRRGMVCVEAYHMRVINDLCDRVSTKQVKINDRIQYTPYKRAGIHSSSSSSSAASPLPLASGSLSSLSAFLEAFFARGAFALGSFAALGSLGALGSFGFRALGSWPRLGFSGASFHMAAIYNRIHKSELVYAPETCEKTNLAHGLLCATRICFNPLLHVLSAEALVSRGFPLGFVGSIDLVCVRC